MLTSSKTIPTLLFHFCRELVKTLHDRGTAVYLVSGGFKRIIQKAAKELDICNENIFANTLLFDNEGMFPKKLFLTFCNKYPVGRSYFVAICTWGSGGGK